MHRNACAFLSSEIAHITKELQLRRMKSRNNDSEHQAWDIAGDLSRCRFHGKGVKEGCKDQAWKVGRVPKQQHRESVQDIIRARLPELGQGHG